MSYLSKIEFKLAPHNFRPGVTVCQIFKDGQFVAAIYPNPERFPNSDLMLVSTHIESFIKDISGKIFAWLFE